MSNDKQGTVIPRRDFLKTSAAITTATMASGLLSSGVWAQGNDRMRVGLIGCGGRGNGAARDHMSANAGGELYAVGDLFEDRAKGALNGLKEPLGDKHNVTEERCFWGFDAYQKVIDSGVDLVVMGTPPGYRPPHFKAAIEAGKHVFMEKPVAVCPAGIRVIMEAGKLAAEKKLGVVAGTQRRHQRSYQETIKRIHDGAIGKVLAMQVYWNQGGLWSHDHAEHPDWDDVTWQVRNWLYFAWASGDHICEQHIHNLDIANWVLQAHPTEVVCLGGRQVRTEPRFGHIYDHFAADFTYPDGVKVLSMCRQIDGTDGRVGEDAIGTEGRSGPGGWLAGKEEYHHKGDGDPNPYEQEHRDLVDSIRAGEPLNEAQQVAESTMCAIMARMSAYTGKKVTWDWAMNESKLDLMATLPTEFGDREVDEVAMPGKTPLV